MAPTVHHTSVLGSEARGRQPPEARRPPFVALLGPASSSVGGQGDTVDTLTPPRSPLPGLPGAWYPSSFLGHQQTADVPPPHLPSEAAPPSGVSLHLRDVGFRLHEGVRVECDRAGGGRGSEVIHKQLLSNITCHVPAGHKVAVMGPSGSGKSTLLGVLSGQATHGLVIGTVQVAGQNLRDGLACLRHVTGFVPQDDILLGELTVKENILYQAQLRLEATVTDIDVMKEVESVAEDLHLTHILNSRVGTPEKRGVSGGERKRVSIAMELVTQPKLLFADEPTSGLDSTTAHEVVGCLNRAAQRRGTTLVAVIHQPRYETLLFFDMMILLATGGTLVYSGSPESAVEDFTKYLHIAFESRENPADVMVDSIQDLTALPDGGLKELRQALLARMPRDSELDRLASVQPESFRRCIPPFFRAVLLFMDRAMLQTMRARSALVINQVLCITVMLILCAMLENSKIDHFLMQSCLATLFLMLLQGVAAQRIFGADLLITLREARVGMPMVAYMVAKDLAAMFEITLSAAVFASAYGPASGTQQSVFKIFAGAWAFVYSVYGLGYISSICFSPGAAQMTAVVAAFVSFCVSGVYQPQLPEMAGYFGGRGWMIPALSSVRWFWGFLVTAEMQYLTPLSREYGGSQLKRKGYDLAYLSCSSDEISEGPFGVITLQQMWSENRGWVCSGVDMLLLGIMFRFLAGACLILYLHAKTSWAQFFGDADRGHSKVVGRVVMVFCGALMLLFLLFEVWIFGIQRIDFKHFLG